MKIGELSNKQLLELQETLKEFINFLGNEKNKLEEIANERRNPKQNR